MAETQRRVDAMSEQELDALVSNMQKVKVRILTERTMSRLRDDSGGRGCSRATITYYISTLLPASCTFLS